MTLSIGCWGELTACRNSCMPAQPQAGPTKSRPRAGHTSRVNPPPPNLTQHWIITNPIQLSSTAISRRWSHTFYRQLFSCPIAIPKLPGIPKLHRSFLRPIDPSTITQPQSQRQPQSQPLSCITSSCSDRQASTPSRDRTLDPSSSATQVAGQQPTHKLRASI